MKPMGMYIHIPFCVHKCEYCDFVSFDNKEEYKREYVECLVKEIKDVGTQNRKDFEENRDDILEIKTIYIGGGTPSILNEDSIDMIVSAIKDNYSIAKDCEVTIEINPGTVNKEKLKKYKEIGINRLSIGLQAVQEHVLKVIGRIHDYNTFENTYKMAREIGFQNINVDLMIGLPKQNLSDVEKSIEKIISLKPEHISVYSLIVEEGTNIEKNITSGILTLPNEDIERKEYWIVKRKLEEAGYKHYEISNFAKPDKESRHNMDCWNQKEYLGFGIAAHSYTDGVRYSNIDDIEKYINNIKEERPDKNFVFHENQNKESMMKEFMLLGLRKIDGVQISKFKEKFVENPIYRYRIELDKLVKEGLVEVGDDFIYLTEKGIDLANIVWEEFV